MSLLSNPSLDVTNYISPHYQVHGTGLTDSIFLVGHADGLELNNPYQVSSIQEAVNKLGADIDSPLLTAMLEAYFSGAMDIWLVAAAPMSEYEPDLEARDTAYYEAYAARLDDTYRYIKQMSQPEIVVPLEAPFNSSVDFLTPLANMCFESHNEYGDIRLGLLGTRGIISDSLAQALLNDGRLGKLGASGKHVGVFLGDVTYHLKEMPYHHTSSPVVAIAAEMAQLPMKRGVTHILLRSVLDYRGPNLSKELTKELSEAGYNVVGRTLKGRRGQSFQVTSFTDNTMAEEGSDFWSFAQMRTISRISQDVQSVGRRFIGNIGFPTFKRQVMDYLSMLVLRGDIRGYEVDIARDDFDYNKVLVDMTITPYFGVRNLDVRVHIGPGQ